MSVEIGLAIKGLSFAHEGAKFSLFDGLDLSIESGEVTALVGKSGCGKSSLLKLIAGVYQPTDGVILWDGSDAESHSVWHPQTDNLLAWKRVLSNVALGAILAGQSKDVALKLADSWLEQFNLSDTRKQWPSQLSGGMRQRVALLRTVMVGRPLLLLDEPFGALDAITGEKVSDWFLEVLEETNRTAVIVTHDLDEAIRLGDRVLVMADGQIVDDVRADSAVEVVKAQLLESLESE